LALPKRTQAGAEGVTVRGIGAASWVAGLLLRVSVFHPNPADLQAEDGGGYGAKTALIVKRSREL